MSKKNVIIGIISLLVIGGLVFAYISIYRTSASQKQSSTIIIKKNEPVLNFTSVYKEDYIPLKQVANYRAVKAKYGLRLTSSQEKFLDQNKFLLVNLDKTSFKPGVNFDQMLADFDSMTGDYCTNYRRPEDTKLITPDIVLHAYHKFFGLTLEQLEQKELSEALNDFLVSLYDNLATAVMNNSGYIKERYQNLEAQIVLARVLFENKNPEKPDYFEYGQEDTYYEQDKTIDSAPNAKKILVEYSSDLTPELIEKIQYDLDKIYAADGVGSSPLFQQYSDGLKTDYTQFTPRSHYNKNSALRAYFRTMMYLGRSSYFLKKDIGIADFSLLAKQFAVQSSNGVTPLDSWNKIMAVTGFYAGQSDDLTYDEWQNFESQILGSDVSDSDLASSANVQMLAQNLNQLRRPKILSDIVVSENIFSQTKADLLRQSLSCRIFGQRFTFDAWVLNDLTAGQEKTGVKLPSSPSALFVPAAMGDPLAQNHVGDFLQKDASFSTDDVNGFFTKLNQKQSDIKRVTKGDWFTSMGSAWLYVLGSLTHQFGGNYPRYMQTMAFWDKQIQTFLGSYTELKHDTLLYAKQSFSEMGGDDDEVPPIPPVVKGFVEPNMDFWNRFIELLDRTDQFFKKNDLLTDRAPLARLQEFSEIVGFYSDIAKKELQGQKISDDDYEKLRTTALSFMAQPFYPPESEPDKNSGKVALIADIHTDAVKSQILYEATGKPYLMLAIVANEQTPRVVASLVYNHYEFTNSIGKRLTDEDWRNWVYNRTGNLPAKNFWYQSFLVK